MTISSSLYKVASPNNKGDKIVAELDDDQNWSQVHKDALMEIVAEVDKDFVSIELDVIDAKRLQ